MQRFRRIYMTFAVTLVTLYIALLVFGLLVGKRLVFPMPASSYQAVAAGSIQIPYGSSGGYVIAEVHNAPAPKGYILYQHGNGEDLGQIGPRLQKLQAMGWSVLAWDYPGYGLSPGTASEETVSEAMHAVAAYAQETLQWPVSETVLYGRSVGGGPSLLLASESPYRGLILEGTFTSAFRVVTRIKVLPIDVFDNWSRIEKINMPVLFLHGTRDFVVPFSHGKKLYASAKEPKYNAWFEGGGHNNLPEDFAEQYTGAVLTFLNNLPEPQEPEAEAADQPPAA